MASEIIGTGAGAVLSADVQSVKIDGFETWVEGKRFTVSYLLVFSMAKISLRLLSIGITKI